MLTRLDRYIGCLAGLATGDALGTTLEFKSPGSFEPIDDMVGGGPFRLHPGEWTDDTSMALCLAQSLITNGFDPLDQLDAYLDWYRHGYMSSNGRCFDIGNTTREALYQFQVNRCKYPGPKHEQSAGNGSIMRLAPVPMYFARNPEKAIEHAAFSSLTTHGAWECVDACRYLAGLIVGAINGVGKEELLSPLYSPIPELWKRMPLQRNIETIARGSFKRKEPPDIRGTGYVVDSLEAALWAFHKSENFKHGALHAVNLGDDADTTGAVYGQIAGAYYGAIDIPPTWLKRLAKRDLIEDYAVKLYEIAEGGMRRS